VRCPALVLTLTLLALAGCGGDDEPVRESGPGVLTVPRSATERQRTVPRTETTPTATTETAPPREGGGAPVPQAPQPDPVPTPEPPVDSPDNDVPPPADSPAERFEQYCQDNPGACG
jgi:hypothetical protein